METEQIMEGQPQVIQDTFLQLIFFKKRHLIFLSISLCNILQVPENPHAEYGLTENVEVKCFI